MSLEKTRTHGPPSYCSQNIFFIWCNHCIDIIFTGFMTLDLLGRFGTLLNFIWMEFKPCFANPIALQLHVRVTSHMEVISNSVLATILILHNSHSFPRHLFHGHWWVFDSMRSEKSFSWLLMMTNRLMVSHLPPVMFLYFLWLRLVRERLNLVDLVIVIIEDVNHVDLFAIWRTCLWVLTHVLALPKWTLFLPVSNSLAVVAFGTSFHCLDLSSHCSSELPWGLIWAPVTSCHLLLLDLLSHNSIRLVGVKGIFRVILLVFLDLHGHGFHDLHWLQVSVVTFLTFLGISWWSIVRLNYKNVLVLHGFHSFALWIHILQGSHYIRVLDRSLRVSQDQGFGCGIQT